MLMKRLGVTALMLAMLVGWSWAAPLPEAAPMHQRELIRQVNLVWGLSGPVALHAAQIHAESTWRADAVSPMGATGMAQFMPATAQWMEELHPELGQAAPYSPRWAIAAMVRYNHRLYSGIRPLQGDALDRCDHLAMMLAAYNGGQGWLNRDRRLALQAGDNPDAWWDAVEHHTQRADWARTENRNYSRKIIFELEPLYLRAGWRGVPTCR